MKIIKFNKKFLKISKNSVKINKISIKIGKSLKFLLKKDNKELKISNEKYFNSKLIRSYNLYFQYLQSFNQFLVLDSFKNIKE